MQRNAQLVLPTLLVCAAIWFLASASRPSAALAMTSHGTEQKTIATVPLDDGMEAVVTLDHITGDLTGYVLDRFNGKFFIRYYRNLSKDFPKAQGKFLMATGSANFRQITGNERFADGVVYISEEASGQVIAYGLPWNSQLRASNSGPQQAKFLPLDYAKTRFSN